MDKSPLPSRSPKSTRPEAKQDNIDLLLDLGDLSIGGSDQGSVTNGSSSTTDLVQGPPNSDLFSGLQTSSTNSLESASQELSEERGSLMDTKEPVLAGGQSTGLSLLEGNPAIKLSGDLEGYPHSSSEVSQYSMSLCTVQYTFLWYNIAPVTVTMEEMHVFLPLILLAHLWTIPAYLHTYIC